MPPPLGDARPRMFVTDVSRSISPAGPSASSGRGTVQQNAGCGESRATLRLFRVRQSRTHVLRKDTPVVPGAADRRRPNLFHPLVFQSGLRATY